ncbi:MAG: metallophosphoesterase [candidate division WOR-3 bacterium]
MGLLRLSARLVLLSALVGTTAWAEFTFYPYLQNLTDSSIVVRWETATMEPALVEYGLSTEYGLSVTRTEPDTVHELVLTGLIPDTTYHYRVVAGPDSSPDAVFRSAPVRGWPVRFAVIGDTRTDSAAHQSVVDRLTACMPLPLVVLHTGDLTENASRAEYETFFRVEQNLLSRVPLFPVPGNHDLGSMDNWYRFFVLPGNERFYSVRIGNAAFHAVNVYEPFEPGSEQYSWLESELRADSADSTIRHVFVSLHEPPYTTSAAHPSNLQVREHLCPLFERFGVSIVFCGHIHAYEHSLANGVHYVTSGGGGAPLHWDWLEPEPWTLFRLTCYEFVQVEVHHDSVFCQAVQPDGTVFDPFSCTVRKPGMVESRPKHVAQPVLEVTPSPARGIVRLVLRIVRTEPVRVSIHDVTGRTSVELLNRVLKPGEHRLDWTVPNLPSGLYRAILSWPEGSSSDQVVIVR